jgi:hypothetical protein
LDIADPWGLFALKGFLSFDKWATKKNFLFLDMKALRHMTVCTRIEIF